MDAFRCLTDSLCVPFPSVFAPSTTLLPIPSLLSPHPQSWFTLRTHSVMFQAPAFTGSTHYCCQILCSAIHVASFDLGYIFFWAQPVLLGYGSIQTRKPIWLTSAWDCKVPSRGCIVEEFKGAEGSGLTALFWHHTWHLTRQWKKQEHTGRWELCKWALPLNASVYIVLHYLAISIVKARTQMDLRIYSYEMEVE